VPYISKDDDDDVVDADDNDLKIILITGIKVQVS
jgi:hypothetical protein